MKDIIFLYVITLLASASLLFTWFKSSLPTLICAFAKWIGIKQMDNTFWMPPSDVELLGESHPARSPLTWSVEDWEGSDTTQGWAQARLGNFWGELVTCRFCLCYHIVFWVNLCAFVLTGCILYIPVLIAFVASQPILVHLIFNIVERIQRQGE